MIPPGTFRDMPNGSQKRRSNKLLHYYLFKETVWQAGDDLDPFSKTCSPQTRWYSVNSSSRFVNRQKKEKFSFLTISQFPSANTSPSKFIVLTSLSRVLGSVQVLTRGLFVKRLSNVNFISFRLINWTKLFYLLFECHHRTLNLVFLSGYKICCYISAISTKALTSIFFSNSGNF